jgi:hypothetical protein
MEVTKPYRIHKVPRYDNFAHPGILHRFTFSAGIQNHRVPANGPYISGCLQAVWPDFWGCVFEGLPGPWRPARPQKRTQQKTARLPSSTQDLVSGAPALSFRARSVTAASGACRPRPKIDRKSGAGFTLCYAIMLPGRKSAFRAGFCRTATGKAPKSALRPAFGRPEPDFGAFPVAVRQKSGPEGRFPTRKQYCVTWSICLSCLRSAQTKRRKNASGGHLAESHRSHKRMHAATSRQNLAMRASGDCMCHKSEKL